MIVKVMVTVMVMVVIMMRKRRMTTTKIMVATVMRLMKAMTMIIKLAMAMMCGHEFATKPRIPKPHVSQQTPGSSGHNPGPSTKSALVKKAIPLGSLSKHRCDQRFFGSDPRQRTKCRS